MIGTTAAKRVRFGLAALLIAAGAATAFAQTSPGTVPPNEPGIAPPPAAAAAAPLAAEPASLALSAVFASDGRPIRSGVVWRVFAEQGVEGRPKLVARSNAAAPVISLVPGTYTVHVAYGFASASRRVALAPPGATERLALNGGALKLGGAIGEAPIGANRLSFSVYLPVANDSEGRLVAANVKAGEIVRLPEGSYHVVSTYGESNAIMRVDLKVEPGRLTEATVNHRAATLTLKLVAAAGGEAFAGTAFSVLTPGGDVIREAIGAFPTVTLAEGEYTVIARHDGKVYTREFKVESGLDRDIEVLAQNS